MGGGGARDSTCLAVLRQGMGSGALLMVMIKGSVGCARGVD